MHYWAIVAGQYWFGGGVELGNSTHKYADARQSDASTYRPSKFNPSSELIN